MQQPIALPEDGHGFTFNSRSIFKFDVVSLTVFFDDVRLVRSLKVVIQGKKNGLALVF